MIAPNSRDQRAVMLRLLTQFHVWFGGLLAFVFVLLALPDENAAGLINQVSPVAVFICLTVFAVRFVKADPMFVWTPLPWLLLTCAAYYGLGPMLYPFGSDLIVTLASEYHPVSEADLLRTNLLNLVGIEFIMVGYYVGLRLVVSRSRDGTAAESEAESHFDLRTLRRVAVVFLTIGLSVKYLLFLPYEFGYLGFVLPGSIAVLQHFVAFAMVVLMILVHRGDIRWRPILYLLIATEFTTAVLVFSKMALIIFFIMLVLGRILIVRRLRPTLVGAGMVVLALIIVAPIVTYGRATLSEATGNHYSAGLQTRCEILFDYFESGEDMSAYRAPQLGWGRLNYANAQAFAMQSFDANRAGESFGLIAHVMTPRVLWPDKPVMTIGRDFNYLVTGNAHTASAPGLFGEAYWNGGWIAVVFAAAFVGLLLAVFANYALQRIASYDLLYLPVVFAGIKMGLRPDDWCVATYVGAPMIALCLHVGLSFVARILKAPRRAADRSRSLQAISS